MFQGCYKALQAMVMQQSDVMIGVGVAVLVVEVRWLNQLLVGYRMYFDVANAMFSQRRYLGK